MASPQLTADENAHLRGLVREWIPKFGSQNKLAMRLGMQGSSLHAFLKGGGWSEATARQFAELIGMSFDEALGRTAATRRRQEPAMSREATRTDLPPTSGPPAFRPTPRALSVAKTYLKEPPQEFSDEAIDRAAEEVRLTTLDLAEKPSAVAEAIRHTILGSAVHWPSRPRQQPSSSPPANTRRSKIRGR